MAQSGTVPADDAGLVDRLLASRTNYHVALVGDLIAALAFLVFGFERFAGPRSEACGAVLLGVLAFSLLEYAVHRWVLHGPPSWARRGHARHHAEPTALVATPCFTMVVASLTIWQLLCIVFPAGSAALLVFGLYAGYNYFALFHHWEHHHRPAVAWGAYWRRLDQMHHVHHHRPSVNFGISTTIWDRVFGTFASSRPRAYHVTGARNRVAVDRTSRRLPP